MDLALITNKTDGFMDNIHELRNLYGADLVALLVDEADNCGIGWLMGTNDVSDATKGFSVTDHRCITNNTPVH